MIFNIARCFADRIDYGFMMYIMLALSIWADVMFTISLCITFFAANSICSRGEKNNIYTVISNNLIGEKDYGQDKSKI